MSLHAQLSPEAQARLASQQRMSTITSLIIALLLMVLVGLILWIIAMNLPNKNIPQLVSYNGTPESEENLKQKKVQTQIERKPSAPSASMSKVIAANTSSPTAVPVPEIDVPDPSTDFGDGNDFGDGWGDGDGSGAGGGFGNIPTAMKKRCSKADRLQRLTSNGGTEKCEDAVVTSLRWLKEKQNKDGSWTGSQPVAMTGLALLAYLGHCETAGSEEFGDTVLAAITFLVDKAMKNNGKLATDFKAKSWCYEHAIAVYALAEAYTLCVKSFGENITQLEDAVMASGQFLINSQATNGGWAYSYVEEGGHTDTSIVGWQLQAIKACKFTGLDFANLRRCVKKALDYMETKQAPSGAFGYSSPAIRHDGTTLAAVGALSFQIWESSANRQARKAVKFMDKNMKFDWKSKEHSDLYGHYYAAQVMINNGGEEWKKYNELFRDEVLKNQNKDGSYKSVQAGHGLSGGGFAEHYRTCLATLMLESYYRFLPGTGQKQ
ncbi:terpene cyclase/mutase family protein [Akkermansiaceae bacterium]|nr:terpene cyclase/mutase family protein [Akkermansiaceae bacterium]